MRQLIPALLLLTLLLPAAAAAQSPFTRVQFVAALWTCSGAVPYDANGPFSDVNPNSPGATAVAWAYDLGIEMCIRDSVRAPRQQADAGGPVEGVVRPGRDPDVYKRQHYPRPPEAPDGRVRRPSAAPAGGVAAGAGRSLSHCPGRSGRHPRAVRLRPRGGHCPVQPPAGGHAPVTVLHRPRRGLVRLVQCGGGRPVLAPRRADCGPVSYTHLPTASCPGVSPEWRLYGPPSER